MNREKINDQLASAAASHERQNQQAQRDAKERTCIHRELVQSRKDTLELAREASVALKKKGVKPDRTVSIKKDMKRPLLLKAKTSSSHMDGWQLLDTTEPNGDYGVSVHGYVINEGGVLYRYSYSGERLPQFPSAEEVSASPEKTEYDSHSLQEEHKIQLGIVSLLAKNNITSLD